MHSVYLNSLIITPDTASSRAAMRAEVPTDNPRARWDSEGCGGRTDTSVKEGVDYTTWQPRVPEIPCGRTLVLINAIDLKPGQQRDGDSGCILIDFCRLPFLFPSLS